MTTEHNKQASFTAADMADQAASAFERGRESVLAERHAAAPATYFPLTLRGLIAYGQVAADPSQGAVPNHMRYLIEQMVPHLKRLDEIENSTPTAPGIDLRSQMLRLAEKWERQAIEHGVRQFTGNDHLLFANELRVQIDVSPEGGREARDGERYRWLRERWGRISETYDADTPVMTEIGDDTEGWITDGDSLDRCIDAAMQASDAEVPNG